MMKNKFKIGLAVMVLTLMVALTSCDNKPSSYQEATAKGTGIESTSNYFITLLEWRENDTDYEIVYAADTKVKYLRYTYDEWCPVHSKRSCA